MHGMFFPSFEHSEHPLAAIRMGLPAYSNDISGDDLDFPGT
jgi:hypothetical protein